jgi:REP element-mobilizing transposase RayT
MQDVRADQGCEPAESNGEPEHVHPAGELPAKGQDHPAGQQPKGVSSRRLRLEFPDLRQALLAGEAAVVRVLLRRLRGVAPISVLRQYIE